MGRTVGPRPSGLYRDDEPQLKEMSLEVFSFTACESAPLKIWDIVNDLILSFSRDDRHAKFLRARVRLWSAEEHLPETQLQDVLIVASELLSNAVRAAVSETTIAVCLMHTAEAVCVQVTNIGTGFDINEIPVPSHERVGGRGLAIMRALGVVAVSQIDEKTVVTVTLRPPIVRA